ncbi:MAG: FAD-binding oxidoreductase [Roseovarius sp.]|nr:FAD-binding oxidoreductase [Roseovarius sp.]
MSKGVSAEAAGRIEAIVGAKGIRPAAEAQRYMEDPRDRFTGKAGLVVMPDTTEVLAEVVRLCGAEGIALIPYGGGTGVVAGQLSLDREDVVILSLERMNRIREIRADDGVMVVEAGCVLENVHAAAAEHGLQFPLGMASKGSCTIGGNLATNAGGIQVLRHGNARDLCLGIEAVLPSGEILRELSPLRKNNTGFDLRHLLIGSEGTLGIITAATLIVKPIEPEVVTVFAAVPGPAEALALYQWMRRQLGEAVSGIELMSGFGVGLVTGHFANLRNPLAEPSEWYVLTELAGHAGLQDNVEGFFGEEIEAGRIADAVLASSEAQRQALWDLREHTPEANRLTGAICSSDTSVPIASVERFVAETHAALAKLHPGLRVNSYGHIGDGNIHHNVFPPEGVTKPDFVGATPGIIEAVRMAINEVTVACDGAISAEHGIGRLKVNDLARYAQPAKLNTIRAIKAAMDPKNILNPGALIG